jgi:hypothetical protein
VGCQAVAGTILSYKYQERAPPTDTPDFPNTLQVLWPSFREPLISVADPGMFIPDPAFYPSRIQHTAKKKRGKNCAVLHLCGYKYHKIENYFIFDLVKKKIRANLHRIMVLFTKNIVTNLS